MPSASNRFGSIAVTKAISESVLEQAFGSLEGARKWSPRVVSRLESMVRHGEDRDLFRINPLKFATQFGIAEPEAVDLFVHASAIGLFETDWLLLCPMCACVVESFASLVAVDNHYHCPMCRCDYEAMLDEFVAVTFTVSSAVRPIAFHDSSALGAADYCFECRMTTDGLRPDGIPLALALKAVSNGVQYLPAQTVVSFGAKCARRFLFRLRRGFARLFRIPDRGAARRRASNRAYQIRQERMRVPESLVVAPGKIVFEVENTGTKAGLLTVCSIPPGAGRAKLQFCPFLTGGRLLVTQSFRELFRSEVIRASEGLGVRDVTIIFTDLKGSTALYELIGDLKAFSLVQQHFARLLDVTVQHGGAVIKTIGDAVMAAFEKPEDAVRAALAMREEIARFNASLTGQDVILKIGIHRGPSIAVTLNERLDYFGRTVNIAARVQGQANGEEICLSESVRQAGGVEGLLAHYPITQEQIFLKGIDEQVTVFPDGEGRRPRPGLLRRASNPVAWPDLARGSCAGRTHFFARFLGSFRVSTFATIGTQRTWPL